MSQCSRSRPSGQQEMAGSSHHCNTTVQPGKEETWEWHPGGLGLSAAGVTLSIPVGFPPPFVPQPRTPAQPSLFAKDLEVANVENAPPCGGFLSLYGGKMRQNMMRVTVPPPPLGSSYCTGLKGGLAAGKSKSRLWPCGVSDPRTRCPGSGTTN